jgi:hypothetical protein
MPSAMSSGRDDRIARRYRSLLMRGLPSFAPCALLAARAAQLEQDTLRARFSRHAFKLRFYLKYSSGPRLISRTCTPQRVLCEIAVFIPRDYRIGQLL